MPEGDECASALYEGAHTRSLLGRRPGLVGQEQRPRALEFLGPALSGLTAVHQVPVHPHYSSKGGRVKRDRQILREIFSPDARHTGRIRRWGRQHNLLYGLRARDDCRIGLLPLLQDGRLLPTVPGLLLVVLCFGHRLASVRFAWSMLPTADFEAQGRETCRRAGGWPHSLPTSICWTRFRSLISVATVLLT
jgi:hypothetical protein